jgi:hypothetical protein
VPVSDERGRPNRPAPQYVQSGRDAYVAGRDVIIGQSSQAPAPRHMQPEDDSWVVAIYASEAGGTPLGSGVVIDRQRVLTCAHVVVEAGAVLDEVWVAFPMADPPAATRCGVVSVSTPGGGEFEEDRDVALLELADPIPEGVTPARLRHPTPKSLIGGKWWALGFPPSQPRGSVSEGEVGAALAAGWVRIDVESRYPIEPGFSGTGLWFPKFGGVVGIVAVYDGQRNGRWHRPHLGPRHRRRTHITGWSVASAPSPSITSPCWPPPATTGVSGSGTPQRGHARSKYRSEIRVYPSPTPVACSWSGQLPES